MICSISGEPTSDPVLSLKSRRVFDRRLIAEYLAENGKDPISEEPMTESDLVAIDTSVTSNVVTTRKSNQDSIPSMLAMFQNEWDSLSLEIFELRKQLIELKKELSLSLYRQDAAVKVASRAMKERDEARQALQDLATKIGSGNIPDEVEEEEESAEGVTEEESLLPEKYAKLLTDEQHSLFTRHKAEKHKLPFVLTADSKLNVVRSIKRDTSHREYKMFRRSGSQVAIVYLNGDGEIVDVGSKEIKLVTNFKVDRRSQILGLNWFHTADGEESLLVTIKGKVINITGGNGKGFDYIKSGYPLKAVVVHPSLPVSILLSANRYSIYYERTVIYKSPTVQGTEITGGAIHNDGVVMALSLADSSVDIYDIVQQKKLLTIEPPPSSNEKVSQLLFAPNGFWLLIKYGTSAIGVYDLRKGSFQSVLEFSNVTSIHSRFSLDPASRILLLGNWYAVYEKKAKHWSEPLELLDAEESKVDIEITEVVETGYLSTVIDNSGISVDIISA
ncbi:DEKNAAC103247 [Brettanomyces naardenensis]|uniref:Pre-mRNA-processing factor 19 n=1 Tax=Brettanomyces naardenensis TaxID=13370 RepID=A0A448YMU8_BRENA|nr:DEKNAAC103247 [Brettanomyces naardenensis]